MNNYQLTIKEVLYIIKTSRNYGKKSSAKLHTITVKELIRDVLNLKYTLDIVSTELNSVVRVKMDNDMLAILEAIEYIEDTEEIISLLSNNDTSVKGLSKLPKPRLVEIFLRLENLMYRIEDILEVTNND
ncbi:p17 protein [Bacillus phage Nf]|uniref:P17 protein n=1 Tax=Bacillus phage Nf TaxID=2992639 RepID=B7SSP4_BPNF|nr:p17 protein [Bacillus phage Nf]ACH57091.1 p17 protein [Bacillus phage Nf]